MIERIEALNEKATSGPWHGDTYLEHRGGLVGNPYGSVIGEVPKSADRAFIAHARQLLPLMLRELDLRRQAGIPRNCDGDLADAIWKEREALDAYCAEHLLRDEV